jgi:hypothetical protein
LEEGVMWKSPTVTATRVPEDREGCDEQADHASAIVKTKVDTMPLRPAIRLPIMALEIYAD